MTDYLGNEFATKKQMLLHYNVSHGTFNDRQRKGWTLEECLTGRKHRRASTVDSSKRTDHLGKVFESVDDMCAYWNVSPGAYRDRIRKGKSLEEALTGNFEVIRNNDYLAVSDHLGNVFPTLDDMLRHYNVTYGQFHYRQSCGYSLEDCLCSGQRKSECEERTDHLGNTFKTNEAMCEYYNVHPETYRKRRKKGLSVKDALTLKGRVYNLTFDPYGQAFPSDSAMCKHYNISTTCYKDRINSGWTQLDALTVQPEYSTVGTEDRTDHTGTTFESLKQMVDFWHIPKDTYKVRINKLGWSKEKALTTPVKSKNYTGKVVNVEDRTDHKGNVFETKSQMLEFYNLDASTFRKCINRGETKNEILAKYEDKLNRKKLANQHWNVVKLVYISDAGEMFYLCTQHGVEEVLTVNELKCT